MSKSHTNISLNRTVCQISLQSSNRQFISEEGKHCICNTQVSFAVFKIYRINLVRHCRRPDFTFYRTLFYPTIGNITPNILTEIYQNHINTFHAVEYSGKTVVRFNLCCYRIVTKSKHQALHKSGSFTD